MCHAQGYDVLSPCSCLSHKVMSHFHNVAWWKPLVHVQFLIGIDTLQTLAIIFLSRLLSIVSHLSNLRGLNEGFHIRIVYFLFICQKRNLHFLHLFSYSIYLMWITLLIKKTSTNPCLSSGMENDEVNFWVWPWAVWEGEGQRHYQDGPRVWSGDYRQKLSYTLQLRQVCDTSTCSCSIKLSSKGFVSWPNSLVQWVSSG